MQAVAVQAGAAVAVQAVAVQAGAAVAMQAGSRSRLSRNAGRQPVAAQPPPSSAASGTLTKHTPSIAACGPRMKTVPTWPPSTCAVRGE